MQTVRGPDGEEYVLMKRSSDASLVRDPRSGERRHLPNRDLETTDGESPLATLARGVPDSVRALLTATNDDRALGLLVDLAERGPLTVRTMLSEYDLCESDVHAIVTEFQIADLVRETDVGSERGYEATETAIDAFDRIQRD